ncbi:MAG: transporter [Rubrivivax sp.]
MHRSKLARSARLLPAPTAPIKGLIAALIAALIPALIPALGAALLAGCAALAPPERADSPAAARPALELPAQWSQGPAAIVATDATDGAASRASRDWWQGFHDAPLLQLVDRALAHNLDLRSAAVTLQHARALRELAAATQQPALGLSASAARNRSGGGGGNSSSLRVGVDASWEADLFGAQAAARTAAQADVDSAAATLSATRLAIAAETGLAYLQWQAARAQQAAAASSLAKQRQTQALVALRERTGLAGGLELEQARSAVLQLEARLAALQHTQAQAQHALALLTGTAPPRLAPGLDAARTAPAERVARAPALPALPQPAALLQRRPDLQAAEHRIASQLATLAQRQAERRPSLRISGNLGLQAATLSALGGSGALVAGLVAAIDWTLLDGGAGRARVDAQQAALDAARLDWQAAVLAAARDVEDALSALASARERETTLQRAARAADEAARLARIGYETGISDFLNLLDAERSASSAAEAWVSAQSDLAASHIRLYKALGGGWSAGPAPEARSTRP